MVSEPKIRFLPDAVIYRIAAGQIVRRPACVVKELVENALDAGATTIQLIIKDAGKTLIQVIDDGCGMNAEDVRLCIEKHATSKIAEPDDLFKLHTYGFRGEAVNAMTAVAEVEIMTRIASESVGTRLLVGDGKIKEVRPSATPVGTNVMVRYLFNTLPVHRQFLKGNAVEMRHILRVFEQMAIANPEVAFTLFQNGHQVHELPPAKLGKRIIDLFTSRYQKKLLPCDGKTAKYRIHGYIGPPQEARKSRGGQFFFVNKRYIKDSYLHHAIKKAYDSLIGAGVHPFYVIFITVPPDEVDVNVHPTKTEVKFKNERLLYTLLLSTVRKVLARGHCMHGIDFKGAATQALFDGAPAAAETFFQDSKTTESDDEVASFFPAWINDKQGKEVEDTMGVGALDGGVKPFFESEKADSTYVDGNLTGSLGDGLTDGIDSEEGKEEGSAPFAASSPSRDVAGFLGAPPKIQLHKRYIVAQAMSGLLLIDQVRAYERIFYEDATKEQATQSTSQKVLFPQRVLLQSMDFSLVEEFEKRLRDVGFAFDIVQPNEVIITGHPSYMEQSSDAEDFFIHLLEEYRMNSDAPYSDEEKWLRALAKRRAGFFAGVELTNEDMDVLVSQLFQCAMPNYTPDGKSVWDVIPLEEIAF